MACKGFNRPPPRVHVPQLAGLGCSNSPQSRVFRVTTISSRSQPNNPRWPKAWLNVDELKGQCGPTMPKERALRPDHLDKAKNLLLIGLDASTGATVRGVAPQRLHREGHRALVRGSGVPSTLVTVLGT